MTDIFISYSHKDEVWKDKLQAPLRALQLHNDFDVWDDRQIGLGDNWLPEIEKAIEQARVAVLLVSNDFLMSDFVVQQEIPRLLQRRAEEGLRVVPVVVRPCPWQGVSWLAELQGATKDNKPLSSLQGEHEQEDVLSRVAMKIFGLLNDSRKQAQLLREQEEMEQRAQTRLVREQEEEKLRLEARKAQERRRAAEMHERLPTKPLQQSDVTVNQQKVAQFDNKKAGLGNKAWLGIAGVVLLGVTYAANTTGMLGKLFNNNPTRTIEQAQAIVPSPEAKEAVEIDSVVENTANENKKPGLADVIDLPHSMRLMKIPKGSFQMGSDKGDSNEKPVHTVTLDDDFWMGKTEVTFAQYDAYAQAMSKEEPSDSDWGREDRPVINVSWNNAQAYVKWLSTNNDQGLQCRLPSEAEWEYAARAGNSANYAWGDVVGENKANCNGCSSQWDGRQTAPVGSFPENKFGLQDMHGNVWEWVQDCWHGNYQGAPVEGKARETECTDRRRVLRGGGWNNTPYSLRSADRNGAISNNRFSFIGFRIVCSIPSVH